MLCVLSSIAVEASAQVVVGPYSFDEAAVIDAVVQVEGTAWANGWLDGMDSHPFPFTFEQLVASQWDDIVLLGATDIGAEMVFEASFTDNLLVNGTGADLVLFDAIDASGYSVAVQTQEGYTEFVVYSSDQAIDTGVTLPYWWWEPWAVGRLRNNLAERAAQLVWLKVFAIEIDLSDFGLPEGAVISVFRFRSDDQADPFGAAAIHSTTPNPTRSVTWGSIKAMYR